MGVNKNNIRRFSLGLMVSAAMALSACQPLYSTGATAGSSQSAYEPLPGGSISIGSVDTRVGQQVRNHLIFSLQGGIKPVDPAYNVNLRIQRIKREFAPIQSGRDETSGTINIIVSYEVFDRKSGNTSISSGKRVAQASYDRTAQSFANARAIRDAENRAAREVAEMLRLAILSDINKAQ